MNKGGLFRKRWLTGEEESMEKRLGKALIEKGGGHKKLLKRSTKFMNNYDKLNSCEFFFVSYLLYLYLYLCVSLKIKISHHCYSMVVYCFYLK